MWSNHHFAFVVPVPLGLVSCSSILDPAASISTIMDRDEGKTYAVNLYPSTKLIVLVIKKSIHLLIFHRRLFFGEKADGEVSVVRMVMKKWMRDTSYAHNF